MKKFLTLAFFLLLSLTARAQTGIPVWQYVVNPPSGSCPVVPTPPIQIVYSTGAIWQCVGGTWTAFSGGGGSGNPASPNNSVQFNNAGLFGGSAGLTWNNGTNTLTASAINTPQLTANDVQLSQPGQGILQIVPSSVQQNYLLSMPAGLPPGYLYCGAPSGSSSACSWSAGGSGSPGGSSTQVQFNSSGAFAGSSGLTYNSGTSTLTAGSLQMPSTGDLSWLTSGTQNVGFSNPSPGVLSLDTTSLGNRAGSLNMGLLDAVTVTTPELNMFSADTNLVTIIAAGTSTAYQLILPPVAPNGQYLYCLGTGGGVCQWNSGTGSGATFPGTNGLVKNTSTTASVTAVANVDYMGAVGEANYGYVPVSNGGGTSAYGWQAVPLSFGGTFTQYVEQPTSNANWTTLAVNNLNNVFYPEGYSGGAYSGIGQAPVAWTGGTGNLGIGQVVTSGGNAYIAVQANNGTVTPGTNVYFWMPIPTAAASNSGDVAYYSAEAWKHFAHVSPAVQLGCTTYNTAIGWEDYVDGNSFDDEFAVGVRGCGINGSTLNYTGSAAIPVIQRPTSAANYAYLEISDLTINGNYTASSDMDLGKMNQSVLRNLRLTQVATGSDHQALIGYSGGDGFQIFMENVLVDNAVNAQPNAGNFTANISGGVITSFTINNGGSPYYSNPCLGGYACYVSLLGYQGGSAAQPCTVMPTGGMAVTVTGGAVTAITPPTGESGCVGPIDVQVFQAFPVNYGMIWNASDSTIKDLTLYSGVKAGLLDNGGSTLRLHVHPSVINVGIIANGVSGQYVNTECDTIYSYCFEIEQPYVGNSASISGTTAYYPWLLPGAAPYLFTQSTVQANIANSASLCGDGGKPTDYHEFVGQSGPIDTAAQYFTKSPTGLIVTGNDLSCPSLPGDYIPTLSVGTLYTSSGGAYATLGANTFTGYQTINNSMTLAGQANLPALTMGGSSWNPSGNAFQVTSDYAYGTDFALINTSTGGGTWQFISAGVSNGLPGAFGMSNTVNWPLTEYNNSGVPMDFMPSNGLMVWSTSTIAPNSTAQTAGFSSPSSGNIYADSTTLGNHSATLTAGTFSGVTGSFTNLTTIVPTLYSGAVTYGQGAIAYDGSGNNYISLVTSNVGHALTNTSYWEFLGGVSTTITGGTCPNPNQFVTASRPLACRRALDLECSSLLRPLSPAPSFVHHRA